MNAEELMIGNWVYRLGEPHQIALEDMESIWIEFEPIPITFEILEKNNFKNEEKNAYVLKDDPGMLVIITDLKRGIWRILIRKLDGTVVSVIKEYVHEIQQVLRLCGIDKEIEL